MLERNSYEPVLVEPKLLVDACGEDPKSKLVDSCIFDKTIVVDATENICHVVLIWVDSILQEAQTLRTNLCLISPSPSHKPPSL